MKSWPEITEFYDERGGAASGECDFGVQWRGADRAPNYGISVVHDTGDVYVEDQWSREVRLVTTLPHGCKQEAGLKHSLAAQCPYEIAELKLAGWAKICGPIGSLQWALERLQ